MKKTVSDIIDQRLDPELVPEALGHIAKDPDGCRVWRNYHLIRDAIRGEVRGVSTCLLDRVRVELENEPVVLNSSVISHPKYSAIQEVPAQSRPEDRYKQGDVLKAAGLFSVAASILLVSVITLAPQSQEFAKETVASQPVEPKPGPAAVQTAGVNASGESFQAEFGQMLTGHGEFTGAAALNGLLAYAKFVSNQPVAE